MGRVLRGVGWVSASLVVPFVVVGLVGMQLALTLNLALVIDGLAIMFLRAGRAC